jgi:endonuclease/exonuclease/phosphatase family metal-dependent hydrolase
MSSAKSVPPITLVSWNIQTGSHSTLTGNNWLRRKRALTKILLAANPDIFCVQEARLGQLQFLDKELIGHNRVGVGRDDGGEKGEHCAIFYRTARLVANDTGTFWLSDTPDSQTSTWDLFFKRICTWVSFSDQVTGQDFSLFNTHFPLNPFAQRPAAELVIRKIGELCDNGKRILTGDFNAPPNSTAWRLFQESGLRHGQLLESDRQRPSSTYHLNGRPLVCIDAVFVSDGIVVHSHQSLDSRSGGVWPSDHFGSLLEIAV